MKYVLTESRLNEFIVNYLNTFLDNKVVSNHRDFIIVQEKSYDEDSWEDYMEYDYSDGRLWVNRKVLKLFYDLFNLGVEETFNYIEKWFELKFNVEINYLDT
jgi:hypothetical protein